MNGPTTIPTFSRFSSRRRRWALSGLIAAGVLFAAALVQVTVSGPRVSVRWRPELPAAERAALERRYSLDSPEPDKTSATTWHYELGDRSRANLESLVRNPAAEDTNNIDRDALTTPGPSVRVRLREIELPPLPYPFTVTAGFSDPLRLFQLHSVLLLLAGGLVGWSAGRTSLRQRRATTLAVLFAVGVLGWTYPVSRVGVRMGDADQAVAIRRNFESLAGVRMVRFEAHLSYAIWGQVDRLLGQTEESPRRAQTIVARGATVAFLLLALAVAAIERWSPRALRYVALALMAPSALLFLGWREFGYLSLNVAAFPLLRRGLRGDGPWLDAGSTCCGLSAAFHGWGLASLSGACLAALATPGTWGSRVLRVLRVGAWGTAAYVGWIAIYVIVLKLPIQLGHVDAVPWRPWFEDSVMFQRVNPAIFSAEGARLLLMTAWVVGVPLFLVVGSLWREQRDEVRAVLAYAVPSCLLTLLVWHSQGPREDMDVVFAIFPALYALMWVCAVDRRRTVMAAALLASAHLAFWRMLFDGVYSSHPPPA